MNGHDFIVESKLIFTTYQLGLGLQPHELLTFDTFLWDQSQLERVHFVVKIVDVWR
jgi:hypothetical protein